MPETAPETVPAPEETGGASFLDIVKEYRVEITAVAVLAIVGFGLYAYAQHASARAEKAAWNDTFSALFESYTSRSEATAVPAALEEVIRKHEGTDAVFYAYRITMTEYADAGDLEGAVRAAEQFLANKPGHPHATQVRVDLAKVLMKQKNYAAALDQLAQADQAGVAYLQPEILLARAECFYADGKLGEARNEFLNIRGMAGEWPPVFGRVATFYLTRIEEVQATDGPDGDLSFLAPPESPAGDVGASATTASSVVGEAAGGVGALPFTVESEKLKTAREALKAKVDGGTKTPAAPTPASESAPETKPEPEAKGEAEPDAAESEKAPADGATDIGADAETDTDAKAEPDGEEAQ